MKIYISIILFHRVLDLFLDQELFTEHSRIHASNLLQVEASQTGLAVEVLNLVNSVALQPQTFQTSVRF